MARYMASGVSAAGAVSNSTVLFSLQVAAGGQPRRVCLRRLILGVEGATSFAQGPLEVAIYGITQNTYNTAFISNSITPAPQDSQAKAWSFIGTAGLVTAWSAVPTVPDTTPLVRRSGSVLSELNMVLDGDTFTCLLIPGPPAAGGFMVQTIGNSNPTAAGLVVSWTAFIDVGDRN